MFTIRLRTERTNIGVCGLHSSAGRIRTERSAQIMNTDIIGLAFFVERRPLLKLGEKIEGI